MLEQMKTALRVTTDYFDAEIESTIAAARAELVRAGVKPGKARRDDDPLITAAIRTYVLATYSTDQKLIDGYMASFDMQKDNLRKSKAYRCEAKT